MAAKLPKNSNPLNGVHTSGIFADMSIDGPPIGTLVLVVDRARNLPNRKTIGKQDPYCAARLGKEAKKTTTDIRGGQTPKWDQELRFNVHDSPDYYQLKVSVFNDDKKTELIGEAWIDLRDIIVSGGGQSDQWHHLNCRGKYAGEIRIEITFYDTRPKLEKQAPKSKQQPQQQQQLAVLTGGEAPSASLPRPAGPKRRPLPSDPVTGQAPAAAPAPVAEHVQTPPRPQPNPPPMMQPQPPQPQPPAPSTSVSPHPASQPPLQTVEYTTPSVPQGRYREPDQYSPVPGAAPPSAGYGTPGRMDVQSQRPRPVERHDKYAAHPDDRDYDYGQSFQAQQQSQPHAQPPPPQQQQQQQQQQMQLHHQPYYDQQQQLPQQHQQYYEPNQQQPQQYYEQSQQQQQQQQQYYDQQDTRSRYDDGPIPFNAPAYEDPRQQQPVAEDRPPPPPAHRSRNSSGGANDMMMIRNNGYDISPQKGVPPTMRHDVLRSEAHRNSVSNSYPGRPAYRPYDSAPAAAPAPVNGSQYSGPEPSHHPSPPRHYSYDSAYDAHGSRSMQPTVEDVLESPGPLVPSSFRKSGSRMPLPEPQRPQQQHYDYEEPNFPQSASPAPLNTNGRDRNGDMSSRYDQPVTPSSQRQHSSNGYGTSPSPMETRGYSQVSTGPAVPAPAPAPSSPYETYNPYSQQYPRDRSELDDTRVDNSSAYAPPPVPASLVPGVDPGLAIELRSRIQQERRDERRDERRYTLQNGSMATPPRGRQMIEEPPSYGQNGSPYGYSTPQQSQQSFDRDSINYSGGPSPSAIGQRGISPSPSPSAHHTIKRKSISPAPPPSEEREGRRLSGVPFSPDSYDELNPSVASVVSKEPSRGEYNELNGKIITHDGREIDPSDHLPMDTWAPEPEPKQPQSITGTPSSSRPSPMGPQPTPPSASGRRQLRIAGRPPSAGVTTPTYISADPSPQPATPPTRNRLQKKANRQSAMPALPPPGPQNSSPLAPIPHPRHQDNFTPPRQLPRANTFDFPNENHAPMYSTSPGRGGASAPPIPAKIPISSGGDRRGSSSADGGTMMLMSGALPAPAAWDGSRPGGSELALMEEMSRIDIGTGRARRHQQQSRYYL